MNNLNKVIIPTDFSVKSLNFVIEFLKNNSSNQYDIVLLHGYDIPQTISDLLFFSKTKLLNKLQSKEFTDALHVIENHFESSIKTITIDFITSEQKQYIKNYLEVQNLAQIVTIENYAMSFKDKNSFDVNKLLKNNIVSDYKIMHQEDNYVMNNTELISDVFVIN
jgi:hypothetical protein